MVYIETLYLDGAEIDRINSYLNNPQRVEDSLGEDSTIIHSVVFNNGYSADVKCCGVKWHDGQNNSAWTEAILYDDKGYQVDFSEPESTFEGQWQLESETDYYVVNIHRDA